MTTSAPPAGVCRACNTITASKTLAFTQEMAHTYSAEQYDATTAWIVNTLKLQK